MASRGELETLRQLEAPMSLETLPVPAQRIREPTLPAHEAHARGAQPLYHHHHHTTAQVPSLLHGMARHAASRKTLEPVEAAVLRAFLGADAL